MVVHPDIGKVVAVVMVCVAVEEALVARYVADGETVVVVSRFRLTARRTGRTVEVPLTEVFRVRGGRIVDLQPFYYDTALLRDVLGTPARSVPRQGAPSASDTTRQ